MICSPTYLSKLFSSGHPHHGHHTHVSAGHLGVNPGGSIGTSTTPGGGMIGGIVGVGGMHSGNSGSYKSVC